MIPHDIITSTANPRLREAARLREAPARRDSGLTLVDGGREVWRAPLEQYRVSVLWKAHVYATEAERTRVEHDLLTLDEVVAIFNDDLARRGDPFRLTSASIVDPATRDELRRAYPEAIPVGAGA